MQADIDKAVEAALAAFKRSSKWRTMDAGARGQMLQKLSELFTRDVRILAVSSTPRIN